MAVLGAGVMGAQIAAHFINAGVPAMLFDLASAEGPTNALARRAIERLRKLDPAPLALAGGARHIEAADYDHALPRLADCDLVVEAIGERLDWKRDLYARIGAHVGPAATLVSNTSGLSLAALVPRCRRHCDRPREERHVPHERCRGPRHDDEVLDGLLCALEHAERACAGVVIWQPREPFSLGADPAAMAPAVAAGAWDRIERMVATLRSTRRAHWPTPRTGRRCRRTTFRWRDAPALRRSQCCS